MNLSQNIIYSIDTEMKIEERKNQINLVKNNRTEAYNKKWCIIVVLPVT